MKKQFNESIEFINKQKTQQNHAQIIITIQEPILNQKDAFKYFTYCIVGTDKNGPFNIHRRYSDFDVLRKKLAQRWLGVYLPPINGKRSESDHLYFLKVFRSKTNQTKYIEFRRRFLKYFCKSISSRPYLYYCDLFQIFIRGGTNFQDAIQSCVIKEYKSFLEVYQQSFYKIMQLDQRDVLAEQINTNQNHLIVLKKSQRVLVDISEKIQRVTEAREKFNLQFNISMQKTLPEYQQKFLLNHLNRNRQRLILTKCEHLNQKLKNFSNINAVSPPQLLQQMVMYQIREVKSFIEAIQGRKQAEKRKISLLSNISDLQNLKAKIQQGLFSFRALFMNGSKSTQINQLNTKIKHLTIQLDSISKMIEIMVISTNYELEQFRKRRGYQYKQTFKHLAEQELVQIKAFQQIINMTLSSISSK